MTDTTRDKVHRLLVTGDDKQVFRFHMNVAMQLNGLERRGRTTLFTCMGEDLEYALAVAREAGVTVQEIDGAGDHETYRLLCGDEFQAWKPGGE